MKALIIYLMLMVSVTTVMAQELRVPQQYATIQQAINAAAEGDTIRVSAGTYREHVVVSKNNLVILGSFGSLSTPNDISDDTVIDGSGNGRPLRLSAVSNVTVAGFSILNGRGSIRGANVWATGRQIILKQNLIANGSTTGTYGGYGGGVYLEAEESKLLYNIIRDNWAWQTGGGVDLSSAEEFELVGNLVYNNQSDWGGGVNIATSTGKLTSNIIEGNEADFRDGGGIRVMSSTVEVRNNTIVKKHCKGMGGWRSHLCWQFRDGNCQQHYCLQQERD